MRDIKFREWNGYKMDYNPPVSLIASTSINERFEDSIMMQYTGLKDKHGKDIFEGDIIKTPYTYGRAVYNLFEVQYMDGIFMAVSPVTRSEYLYDVQEEASVIGNIHENPELLT